MGKNLSIAFLDRSTVDLGDVDLSLIRKQGIFKAYDLTEADELVRRSQEADVILTNKCVFGARELESLPNLKLICLAATGTNNIDLAAAKRLGIAVANVAGYSTTTVAEATLLFILSLGHRLPENQRAASDGSWARSSSFAVLDFPFGDIEGKALGIIGYGAIGRRVAKLACAFGMKVLIAKLPGRKYGKSPGRLSLEVVLRKSDFVSLHCPLSEMTRNLINKDRLSLMKKTACLINMARGPVVDDEAVARALRKKTIAGFAADVLTHEPPPADHPFFAADIRDKILLTPHVAWASRESRQCLVDEMGRNIDAFRRGKQRNRVA